MQLTVGYGGLKKAEEESKRAFQPKRIWLPVGVGKEVIFLDDAPACYWEHALKLPDEKGRLTYNGNQFTCNAPDCVLCDNNYKNYYVGLYTVIDCSEYEYKGKIYSNQRRLFAAKMKTLKYLEEKLEILKKGGNRMAGSRFFLKRTHDRAAAVGDVIEFLKEEELTNNGYLADKQYWWIDKDGKEHPPKPFDYPEIVKPLPKERLISIIRRGQSARDIEPWDEDRMNNSSNSPDDGVEY